MFEERIIIKRNNSSKKNTRSNFKYMKTINFFNIKNLIVFSQNIISYSGLVSFFDTFQRRSSVFSHRRIEETLSSFFGFLQPFHLTRDSQVRGTLAAK